MESICSANLNVLCLLGPECHFVVPIYVSGVVFEVYKDCVFCAQKTPVMKGFNVIHRPLLEVASYATSVDEVLLCQWIFETIQMWLILRTTPNRLRIFYPYFF